MVMLRSARFAAVFVKNNSRQGSIFPTEKCRILCAAALPLKHIFEFTAAARLAGIIAILLQAPLIRMFGSLFGRLCRFYWSGRLRRLCWPSCFARRRLGTGSLPLARSFVMFGYGELALARSFVMFGYGELALTRSFVMFGYGELALARSFVVFGYGEIALACSFVGSCLCTV